MKTVDCTIAALARELAHVTRAPPYIRLSAIISTTKAPPGHPDHPCSPSAFALAAMVDCYEVRCGTERNIPERLHLLDRPRPR